MQIDIAFGDVMHPPARDAVYPTLLDTPEPTLHVYPRETVLLRNTRPWSISELSTAA